MYSSFSVVRSQQKRIYIYTYICDSDAAQVEDCVAMENLRDSEVIVCLMGHDFCAAWYLVARFRSVHPSERAGEFVVCLELYMRIVKYLELT